MASLHHADSAVKTPRTPSPSANGCYDPDDLSAQMMVTVDRDDKPKPDKHQTNSFDELLASLAELDAAETDGLKPFLRHDALSQIAHREQSANDWIRRELTGLTMRWDGANGGAY